MPDPIVVLLSVGRHPASLRERRAERDARAMTIALAMGVPIIGLHAGAPCPVLQDYLGMGPDELVVLPGGKDIDPLTVLAAYLQKHPAALILCGSQAEQGACTGMLPYALAHALNLEMIPAVTEVRCESDALMLTQALPGARRRRLAVAQPVVATVGRQGPFPAPVARGPALRRRCTVAATMQLAPTRSLLAPVLEERPARPKPRRIGPVSMDTANATRAPLRDLTSREAAQTIIDFLVHEGVIAAPCITDTASGSPE